MAKQLTPAFILPILLVCTAILVAHYFLQAAGPGVGDGSQGGKISLFLDGAPPISGSTATLRAISTCGAFNVSLDGDAFGSGGALFSQPFLLEGGSHSFFAQGTGCNSTLSFRVALRECFGNETGACEEGGCTGTHTCEGGVFSPCSLPRKICSPGQKIGCSTNGCSFGYAACNQCGTGFGKCLPDAEMKNYTCSNCT